MHPRVLLKLLLRRLVCIDSFCKDCGRDVHDFIAPDDIWSITDQTIPDGHVLCYDCFCERCRAASLPCVYRLEPT
jgi:hypothetical protein